MIFSNANQTIATDINNCVGITQAIVAALSGYSLRCRTGILTIDLLISKVGKVDDPVMHDVITAAVFVNAGSGIEFRRVDIGGCSVGGSPDDDLAPSFRRTHLNPIDVLAIQARLA